MADLELTVVIPVYNEEAIVQQVLNDWLETLRSLNVRFVLNAVNDGSTDASLSLLKKSAEENPEIDVQTQTNRGHGPTLLHAYAAATTPWIFQVDADNEMPARHFAAFWQARNDADLLIGARTRTEAPWPRALLSWAARGAVRILFGNGIRDVNAPYRLYRAEKFRAAFQQLPAASFAPNVLLSGFALLKNFRIKEIPVLYEPRKTGRSSIRKLKLVAAAWQSAVQCFKFRLMVQKRA